MYNKKEYYQKNKERLNKKHKEWCHKFKKEIQEYSKQYRIKHKEQIKKYRDNHKKEYKQYCKSNEIKLREDKKEYYKINKEKINKTSKKYREINKNRIKKLKKKWYNEHKEYCNQKTKKYYQIHKDKIKIWKQKYGLKNRKKLNKIRVDKRKTDINFRILCNLRIRIWKVLKGINKSKHTLELLGCSLDFLKQHFESKFIPGMSWSNYGKWHIDHIKPCASFDLSKPSEQKKCFNYINLQPLWALDNLRKNKF